MTQQPRESGHEGGTMHYTLDSSEPPWWIDGDRMPDDWTVKGELMLRGPDGQWVGVQFNEGCPTTELIGMVGAVSICDGRANDRHCFLVADHLGDCRDALGMLGQPVQLWRENRA